MVSKLTLFISLIALGLSSAFAETKAPTGGESVATHQSAITIVPEIGDTNFHVTGRDSGFKSASLIGAAARFNTSMEKVKWSVGLQYLQTGYKLKQDFGFLSIILGEVSMEYLAIPLKAEYMFGDPNSGGFKFFANGGLTPAYLLSAKRKDVYDGDGKEKGIRGDMNGLDILAGAGIGGRFGTSIGAFEIVFEYQKGLMKIEKEDNIKNEGYIAKVGYNYAL